MIQNHVFDNQFWDNGKFCDLWIMDFGITADLGRMDFGITADFGITDFRITDKGFWDNVFWDNRLFGRAPIRNLTKFKKMANFLMPPIFMIIYFSCLKVAIITRLHICCYHCNCTWLGVNFWLILGARTIYSVVNC